MVQLFFVHLLKIEDAVSSVSRCPNKFIQADLQGLIASVLRILDQKDHQERGDRRPSVYNKLPRIAEIRERPRHSPGDAMKKTWQPCRSTSMLCGHNRKREARFWDIKTPSLRRNKVPHNFRNRIQVSFHILVAFEKRYRASDLVVKISRAPAQSLRRADLLAAKVDGLCGTQQL